LLQPWEKPTPAFTTLKAFARRVANSFRVGNYQAFGTQGYEPWAEISKRLRRSGRLQTPLAFSAIANTIGVLGDCRHHWRSRRLQTPLPFSAIANTIAVLGDCKHHRRSRRLQTPLAFSAIANTIAVLRFATPLSTNRRLLLLFCGSVKQT
jgi:hypothetical protein